MGDLKGPCMDRSFARARRACRHCVPLAAGMLAALALVLALAAGYTALAASATAAQPMTAGSTASRAPESPDAARGEAPWALRGIWLDNGYLSRLAGRAGVARLMQLLATAGFNAVFVESLYRGYTLYPGPYQDRRFEAWGEDPLRVIVEEAHRRQLRVHAWMWMLGAGIHGEMGPLLAANPDWADRSARGELFASGGSRMAWLDPSRPEVRAWLADEAARVASRYRVDGIHLDYVRYNDELRDPFGYSPHALAAFKAQTGVDLAGRTPDRLTPAELTAWRHWREAQITALVRAVRDAVERASPDAFLSAAVLPERTQARLMHLQDWVSWLADGLIDLAIPMAYTSSAANLSDMLASLSAELAALSPWRAPEALRRRVAPGLALFATNLEGIADQLARVQAAGFGGVVLFSASYLSLPLQRSLAAGPFARPAAHPPRLRQEMAALPPLPAQPFPEPVAAPPVSGLPATTNLARVAQVSVDSSFRGYSPAPLNDGQRNDVPEVGRWAEVAWASAERPGEHWIELRWREPQLISQVDVYWALDRGRFFPSSRLRVEAYLEDESRWQVLWEYSATPTHRIARTSITFTPVRTRALRLVQPSGGGPPGRPDLMWVAEVEVYGPGPSSGSTPGPSAR